MARRKKNRNTFELNAQKNETVEELTAIASSNRNK